MFAQLASAAALSVAAMFGTAIAMVGDCGETKPAAPAQTVSLDQDVPAAASHARGSILDVAASAGQFKTLAAAIEAAGFGESFRTGGPYTVFAPTDEAFAKLGEAKLAELLKPENRDTLRSILRYHVVKGSVKAVDAVKAGAARTRQGGEVAFAIRDGRLVVNQSNVVKTDIAASNGVIHVIDTVLLPPM